MAVSSNPSTAEISKQINTYILTAGSLTGEGK
jgi:hypothetical protein